MRFYNNTQQKEQHMTQKTDTSKDSGNNNGNNASNFKDSLANLMKSHPEGGEILLDDYCKAMGKNTTRNECVKFLKESNQGKFVTGRRGKPSRFVYGAAIEKLNNPAPKPASPRKPKDEDFTDSYSLGGPELEFQVKVGDQITSIPVRLGIKVAA